MTELFIILNFGVHGSHDGAGLVEFHTAGIQEKSFSRIIGFFSLFGIDGRNVGRGIKAENQQTEDGRSI